MSTATEMLTAIDAAILARVNGESMEEASGDAQRYKSMTLEELIAARREYKRIADAETTDARKMQRTKITYAEVSE